MGDMADYYLEHDLHDDLLDALRAEQPVRTPHKMPQPTQPNEFATKVVGMTFVQPQIDWNKLNEGDDLAFFWEHNNPYGPRFLDAAAQAIAVVHVPSGQRIGYLASSEGDAAARVCGHLYAQRDGQVGGYADDLVTGRVTLLPVGTDPQTGALLRGIFLIVTLH